ncbi:MAG: PSD1 and planctomycete cytochrome C domain-containing protein [Bryobacterales bacterium]
MQLRLLIFALLAASPLAADPASDFFENSVRPVLAKNCFACHSETKMGGLQMTSRELLLTGGNSGPAISPGHPEQSLLLQAVRQTHERLKMPPSGKLEDEQIAALARWVQEGAVWPEHKPAEQPPAAGGPGYTITPEQRGWWSFQPIRKPAAPRVGDKTWSQTPIDRFVMAKLEEHKLRPAEPAAPRILLRRAYYDLTGLPPAPADVEAFERDPSPKAFAAVVDLLLASPRYGERWGRYWLDIARYSDDKLNPTADEAAPNVWRYRDWVIGAFNDDMPYDQFVKAQIAGDLMEPKERYVAGLGFFAYSPEFQDDRVDALTRGMMGLTVACARCHDHKFDPIPTRDYYSLLGIFENTKEGKFPLASAEAVQEYERLSEQAKQQAKVVRDFEDQQARQLAAIFATHTARYLKAARGVPDAASAGEAEAAAVSAGLDPQTLERWVKYLSLKSREHPFLEGWRDAPFDDAGLQQKLLDVIAEKEAIDEENLILLGGKDDNRTVRVVEVKSLERDKYFLWRDLVSREGPAKFETGILYYEKSTIDRFLAPYWKQHLDGLRGELARRRSQVPDEYPYVMTIEDAAELEAMQVHVRGDRNNLGEAAPPQFPMILCDGEQKKFTSGSGRLELAEAIVDDRNPLTARVIVNRVWMYHFGQPLVATPGNFGRLGEKPTHPELLDYLAARLIESKWSLKALHREIMLTKVYALSVATLEANQNVDADNKLLWRANRRRLDVEPMRDTLLFVSGDLNEQRGGLAEKLGDACNLRRTVYGFVSRRQLEGTLALFDFPNPMSTSDARIPTATPLQQLFFMNSKFIEERARSLARRVRTAGDERARIEQAYRLLFQRGPTKGELAVGLEYLTSGDDSWPRYAQALLSSNELLFID